MLVNHTTEVRVAICCKDIVVIEVKLTRSFFFFFTGMKPALFRVKGYMDTPIVRV